MIRDRHFLRIYEQELRLLRDLAGEFASDHARIANRFGLDADRCADPHVEWLLDGVAFLAARVQHKLDGDYAVLTQHLLEMTWPDSLAPTPAAGIAVLELAPGASVPEGGCEVPAGTRLQSGLLPGESSRCRFRTAHPVTVWPVEVARAQYLGGPALAAQGLGNGKARAGLLLQLRTQGGLPFQALGLDRLVLHLAGRDRVAHLLYEALVGRAAGLAGRLPGEAPQRLQGRVSRLGFAEEEAMLPGSPRGFSGFRLLREYFTLPERFLFVALDGLLPLVRRTVGDALELVVLLDRYEPALDGAVTCDQFVLGATPVINLFRQRARPILLEPGVEQYHVVVDRARPMDHEVHSILGVTGYGQGVEQGVAFTPFYAVAAGDPGNGGYFTVERRPRLVGDRDTRSRGTAHLGNEVWLELCQAEGGPLDPRVTRLDVEVLATNRDLPMRLPLPTGELHLSVETGGPVAGARILGGLARPRPSPAAVEPEGGGIWGDVAWRLIGQLSLNHHSLVEGRGAEGLRDLLELHAAAAEPALLRQVEALRDVTARRVTGRLPGDGPATFGRGLEVTMELAEVGFQDGSAFLLGAVLEAFLRRHVALNSFVETVLRTPERGEIMRWPAQAGERHLA